jgi:hypothetical protein
LVLVLDNGLVKKCRALPAFSKQTVGGGELKNKRRRPKKKRSKLKNQTETGVDNKRKR